MAAFVNPAARRAFCWALLACAAAWLTASPLLAESPPNSAAPPALGPTDAKTPALTPSEPVSGKSLLTMIHDGGMVIVPLFVCSFVMMVFVFERFICLRRGRVIPAPFVKRFLHQLSEGKLDRDEALDLCEENGSPVAKIFAAGVNKWGRPELDVEQAVIDAGERVANDLRRHVRLFNALATVCPLLGLLGTVFGMIRAFNVVATMDSSGRQELLATGISQALTATAAGLLVAVPSLVFYWFFVSRVDRLVIDLDDLGQELVRIISAEGLQEGRRGKPARAARRQAAA